MSNMCCPNCSGRIVRVDFEYVCSECGYVADDIQLDGADVMDHNTFYYGVGSEMGCVKGLKDVEKRKYARLASIDKKVASGHNNPELYNTVKSYAAQLGSNESFARDVTKNILSSKVEGVNMLVKVGAGLYLTYRMMSTPRSQSEVAAALGIDEDDMAAVYDEMARALKLDYALPHVRKERTVHLIDPMDYVYRFAQALDMDAYVKEVKEMVDFAKEFYRTSSVKPDSIVAASLYLVSERHGLQKTRSDVCESTYVTPATLNKRLNELRGAMKGKDVNSKNFAS